MKELIQSPVVFNEEQHTYTLGDKQLSGITSIIKKYLFPDMYAAVSQAVLNKAAERGTRIHNLIQLWTMGILSQEDIAELQPFLDAFHAAGLDGWEPEYLVSDNESVASSIDLVCLDKDGNIILCDIKTTSVLHTEYLRWQLSIYAYLFERQNPGLKVHGLKAIHIRDGKCSIVDVARFTDELVESLLTAFRNGEESFVNPMNEVPDGINDLLKAYAENEESLSYISQVKDQYDERKKQLQEQIASVLQEKGLSKIETETAKVSIGKDSERASFDLKAFRDSDIYKACPEQYDAFVKTAVTKGRITVTLR